MDESLEALDQRLDAVERRTATLERRLVQLDLLPGDMAKTGLGLARLIDHLGLDPVTEADVDAALAAEG